MRSVTAIRFRKSLIRSSRWFEERRFLRSESKRTRERTPAAFDQGPSRLRRDINIRGPALDDRKSWTWERVKKEREKRDGRNTQSYDGNVRPWKSKFVVILERRDTSFHLFLRAHRQRCACPNAEYNHSRRWCNQSKMNTAKWKFQAAKFIAWYIYIYIIVKTIFKFKMRNN